MIWSIVILEETSSVASPLSVFYWNNSWNHLNLQGEIENQGILSGNALFWNLLHGIL